MTAADRLALFQQALRGVEELERVYPGYPPFVSLHNQLLFLIGAVTGQIVDVAPLSQVNIGLIAMREIEPRSDATADLLYSVSAEVEAMKKEFGQTA